MTLAVAFSRASECVWCQKSKKKKKQLFWMMLRASIILHMCCVTGDETPETLKKWFK